MLSETFKAHLMLWGAVVNGTLIESAFIDFQSACVGRLYTDVRLLCGIAPKRDSYMDWYAIPSRDCFTFSFLNYT